MLTYVNYRSESRPLKIFVVNTRDYICVFEFKLNGSADEALQQIDDRGNLFPYAADGRTLLKVGVSFDAAERNIGAWKVVSCPGSN